MLNKFEGYLLKEFSEKAGRLAVFSLGLFIPIYPVRMIFIFLMIISLLPLDIHNKKMTALTALPFTRKDLFFNSYFLLIILTTVTEIISAAWFNINYFSTGIFLAGSLIFATAYYSIAIICTSFGLDNFGIPFLIFLADLIIGGIGNMNINPFSYISPIHQKNIFIAAGTALVLMIIAFYVFVKKGVKK